jgi:hypothetical protein
MTQTADRKTKITVGQAPVRVNTYGFYFARRFRMAMLQEMKVPGLAHHNVKILGTSTIIFLEIDNTLLHL